jgi:hypothetical protein
VSQRKKSKSKAHSSHEGSAAHAGSAVSDGGGPAGAQEGADATAAAYDDLLSAPWLRKRVRASLALWGASTNVIGRAPRPCDPLHLPDSVAVVGGGVENLHLRDAQNEHGEVCACCGRRMVPDMLMLTCDLPPSVRVFHEDASLTSRKARDAAAAVLIRRFQRHVQRKETQLELKREQQLLRAHILARRKERAERTAAAAQLHDQSVKRQESVVPIDPEAEIGAVSGEVSTITGPGSSSRLLPHLDGASPPGGTVSLTRTSTGMGGLDHEGAPAKGTPSIATHGSSFDGSILPSDQHRNHSAHRRRSAHPHQHGSSHKHHDRHHADGSDSAAADGSSDADEEARTRSAGRRSAASRGTTLGTSIGVASRVDSSSDASVSGESTSSSSSSSSSSSDTDGAHGATSSSSESSSSTEDGSTTESDDAVAPAKRRSRGSSSRGHRGSRIGHGRVEDAAASVSSATASSSSSEDEALHRRLQRRRRDERRTHHPASAASVTVVEAGVAAFTRRLIAAGLDPAKAAAMADKYARLSAKRQLQQEQQQQLNGSGGSGGQQHPQVASFHTPLNGSRESPYPDAASARRSTVTSSRDDSMLRPGGSTRDLSGINVSNIIAIDGSMSEFPPASPTVPFDTSDAAAAAAASAARSANGLMGLRQGSIAGGGGIASRASGGGASQARISHANSAAGIDEIEEDRVLVDALVANARELERRREEDAEAALHDEDEGEDAMMAQLEDDDDLLRHDDDENLEYEDYDAGEELFDALGDPEADALEEVGPSAAGAGVGGDAANIAVPSGANAGASTTARASTTAGRRSTTGKKHRTVGFHDDATGGMAAAVGGERRPKEVIVAPPQLVEVTSARELDPDLRGDDLADALAQAVLHLEYDVQRQLAFRVRSLRHNTLTNLAINFALSNRLVVATATATSVRLTALPVLPLPTVAVNDFTTRSAFEFQLFEKSLAEMQRSMRARCTLLPPRKDMQPFVRRAPVVPPSSGLTNSNVPGDRTAATALMAIATGAVPPAPGLLGGIPRLLVDPMAFDRVVQHHVRSFTRYLTARFSAARAKEAATLIGRTNSVSGFGSCGGSMVPGTSSSLDPTTSTGGLQSASANVNPVNRSALAQAGVGAFSVVGGQPGGHTTTTHHGSTVVLNPGGARGGQQGRKEFVLQVDDAEEAADLLGAFDRLPPHAGALLIPSTGGVVLLPCSPHAFVPLECVSLLRVYSIPVSLVGRISSSLDGAGAATVAAAAAAATATPSHIVSWTHYVARCVNDAKRALLGRVLRLSHRVCRPCLLQGYECNISVHCTVSAVPHGGRASSSSSSDSDYDVVNGENADGAVDEEEAEEEDVSPVQLQIRVSGVVCAMRTGRVLAELEDAEAALAERWLFHRVPWSSRNRIMAALSGNNNAPPAATAAAASSSRPQKLHHATTSAGSAPIGMGSAMNTNTSSPNASSSTSHVAGGGMGSAAGSFTAGSAHRGSAGPHHGTGTGRNTPTATPSSPGKSGGSGAAGTAVAAVAGGGGGVQGAKDQRHVRMMVSALREAWAPFTLPPPWFVRLDNSNQHGGPASSTAPGPHFGAAVDRSPPLNFQSSLHPHTSPSTSSTVQVLALSETGLLQRSLDVGRLFALPSAVTDSAALYSAAAVSGGGGHGGSAGSDPFSATKRTAGGGTSGPVNFAPMGGGTTANSITTAVIAAGGGAEGGMSAQRAFDPAAIATAAAAGYELDARDRYARAAVESVMPWHLPRSTLDRFLEAGAIDTSAAGDIAFDAVPHRRLPPYTHPVQAAAFIPTTAADFTGAHHVIAPHTPHTVSSTSFAPSSTVSAPIAAAAAAALLAHPSASCGTPFVVRTVDGSVAPAPLAVQRQMMLLQYGGAYALSSNGATAPFPEVAAPQVSGVSGPTPPQVAIKTTAGGAMVGFGGGAFTSGSASSFMGASASASNFPTVASSGGGMFGLDDFAALGGGFGGLGATFGSEHTFVTTPTSGVAGCVIVSHGAHVCHHFLFEGRDVLDPGEWIQSSMASAQRTVTSIARAIGCNALVQYHVAVHELRVHTYGDALVLFTITADAVRLCALTTC